MSTCFYKLSEASSNAVSLLTVYLSLSHSFAYVCIVKVARHLFSEADELVMLALLGPSLFVVLHFDPKILKKELLPIMHGTYGCNVL